MKFALVIVLLSVVVAVLGRPADSDATILREESEITPIGYRYHFETSDQMTRTEVGFLQDPGTDTEHYAVQGSYKYIDPDGKEVEVNYTADEHGFQPEGNIIDAAIVGASRALGVAVIQAKAGLVL